MLEAGFCKGRQLMDTSTCEYLEWDSSFFNLRIGRIRGNHLTTERVAAALDWANRGRINCLYFLAESDDPLTVALAEAAAFHLVDIRVTLDQPLAAIVGAQTATDTPAVRFSRSDDVAALRAIAAVSHRDTRFYYDPGFPPSCCDAFYEMWIDRSCRGYADSVLIADFNGRPSGYLSCHLSTEGKGSIGLLAVASHAQGRGLGRQLLNAALRYFRDNRMNRSTVVTQGRNCNSQRFYQDCGFRTLSTQLWYHRWFQTA